MLETPLFVISELFATNFEGFLSAKSCANSLWASSIISTQFQGFINLCDDWYELKKIIYLDILNYVRSH
jgi:hypothetical protein